MKILKNLSVLILLSSSFALAGESLWQKVLSCDGEAAIVDRHVYHPSTSQVVIRDTMTLKPLSYLQSQGVDISALSLQSGKREIILSGENDQYIYSPEAFHGFSQLTNGTFGSCQDYVIREGKGLKVIFNRWKVPDQYHPSGSCGEIANWYFQDCQ